MGTRFGRLSAAAAVILGAIVMAPPAAAEGCAEGDPSCSPDPCSQPGSCSSPPPCAEGNATCQGNSHGGAGFGSGQVSQAKAKADTARACKPVSISGGPPEISWDPILGIIRVNQCVFQIIEPSSNLQLPPLSPGG
jgi:hypothetical protein